MCAWCFHFVSFRRFFWLSAFATKFLSKNVSCFKNAIGDGTNLIEVEQKGPKKHFYAGNGVAICFVLFTFLFKEHFRNFSFNTRKHRNWGKNKFSVKKNFWRNYQSLEADMSFKQFKCRIVTVSIQSTYITNFNFLSAFLVLNALQQRKSIYNRHYCNRISQMWSICINHFNY